MRYLNRRATPGGKQIRLSSYDEVKKALFARDKVLEAEYNKPQPIYKIKRTINPNQD